MKKLLVFISLIGFVVLAAWHYKFFPFKQQMYLAVPIQRTSSNIPYVEMEVEQKKCLVKVDLGSSSECSLMPDLLSKLSKQLTGCVKWMDMKGNEYESQEYTLPLLKIQGALIKNLKAKEESIAFDTTGSLLWGGKETIDRPESIQGRIGWGLLKGMHPLFDIKKGFFYITRGEKSFPVLKKEGYSVENFQCSSFELSPYGCTVLAQTEYGLRRFLLDTGASKNFIKPSKFNHAHETVIFTIGAQDFKNVQFFPFEFTDRYENIDGILGMSFFEQNIIFLDFNTLKIWIQNN